MNHTDPTAGSATGSAVGQNPPDVRARDEYELNYYGLPITPPEYFDGEHAANVPASGGNPPFCNCGWTRHCVDGRWFELSDHLADMNGPPPPWWLAFRGDS